jgi:hypothetical protein
MSKKEFFDTKICTDLKVFMSNELPKAGKTYHGKLTYHDEFHQTFEEDSPRKVGPMPQCKYHDLVGSLHGKVSMNDHGVLLRVYVRHEDYKNSRELSDIFESEVEQMCDLLSDVPLGEEAETCGK